MKCGKRLVSTPAVVLRGLLLIGLLGWAFMPDLRAFAQDPQDPPRFRSAIDVVSVTAVVRDKRGRFVRHLDRQDFTVIEAGEKRPLIDVRLETDAPVRIALLVDVSGSMRVMGKAVDAQLAARQLLSALGPRDEASIYAFDTRLERVTGFTTDRNRLESALDNVVPPFGQTSLYDAVAETARDITGDVRSRAAPELAPSRLAVVVLTDGIDTSSRLSAAEVSTVASGIDVPVYVLAVMSSLDDPRNVSTGRAMELASELGSLSRWTGGDLFTASAPAHVSLAARQIVDELRHQYVLAFEASSQPGWRPVEIRARNRDHVVRTRAGYVAGSQGL